MKRDLIQIKESNPWLVRGETERGKFKVYHFQIYFGIKKECGGPGGLPISKFCACDISFLKLCICKFRIVCLC